MSSNSGQTVSVKLFIDKEKKRVLFAESDKDFVDILFSFLTLPLGAIVRLFKKQSQMGCLDELYKRICKTMLLSPVNAAAFHFDRLKVKIDDANRRGFYVSTSKNCMNFSPVGGGCCRCGNWSCQSFWECPQDVLVTVEGNGDGVFVKSGLKYIVTDDLQVSAASTSLVFSLCDRFGLQEQAKIEEKILHLNANKITSLLKRALMSKQALTWLCFEVSAASPGAVNIDKQLGEKQANEIPSMFTAIKIKLPHLARKPTYGTINEINPKSAYQRAYIKGGPRNFLVTNDLCVIHFSLTNTLQILREARIPMEKLVEKEIALNKTQVLKLVRAALVTRDALGSVLLPSKK